MPRYDEADAPRGDWYALRAAVVDAGWALTLSSPPRAAQRYIAYRGLDSREFASRDAVCDWLDAGAPAARPRQLALLELPNCRSAD